MPPSVVYQGDPDARPSVVREQEIEAGFIEKLRGLKYEIRADIRDRAALERNFREKFEALNRVTLAPGEFARLLEEIITADVFTAARTLRSINAFTRADGTPLNYTLVNRRDWCKNTFEVVNQLRINTDNSHHRFDVLLLLNGVPVVQIELKTLGISPRRAMEQIVDYKSDPGNGCGGEVRLRSSPLSPRSMASRPPPCKPSWRASLIARSSMASTRRSHGPARPRLEGPLPGRTGPHGGSAPLLTKRAGGRDISGTQRLRIMNDSHEDTKARRDVEELSAMVVDCGYKLHLEAGPGLLETVYEVVLARMLTEQGIEVKRQTPVPIRLMGMNFEEGFRADLIVENKLLIELKSVENLLPVHSKQVLTYLRLLKLPIGLLINFGAPTFKDGCKRIVNGPQSFATSRLWVNRQTYTKARRHEEEGGMP